MKRKCFVCSETNEELLEESHDLPCYLFWLQGKTRRERKHFTDSYRHLLCKKHHEDYERELNEFLLSKAKEFLNKYFKEDNDTSTT